MGTDAPQAWWKRVLWYVLLTLLSGVVLFPIYMTLVRALSTPASYFQSGQPLHPVDIQWDVFSTAFSRGDLGSKMFTSAVVTVIIVAAQLVTSILAAYAFTFLEFRGRRLL